MDTIRNILDSFRCPQGSEWCIKDNEDQMPYAAVNPGELTVELRAGAAAHVVLLHDGGEASDLKFVLHEGARLDLTELFAGESSVKLSIRQEADSACHVTSLALASSTCDCEVALEGRGASNELHGLFIVGGEEEYSLSLNTRHMVADCTSNSIVKGVAGNRATGKFWGLVYVAPDAQRTDARQQSRNILLSEEARIDTKPQLEIYADDVKCTHGATVGQMDDEAILYMRQRGLSLMQARRLQIEGFASDVVSHCGVESLEEALSEAIRAKMEEM